MENQECIICLENDINLKHCTQCTAVYHKECILDMIETCPLYRTCPLCKINLPEEYQYHIQMREYYGNRHRQEQHIRVIVHDMRIHHHTESRRNCCNMLFSWLFGELLY